MEEQLTLEEILREGMISSSDHHQGVISPPGPAKELQSESLQRAAEQGDTEGLIRLLENGAPFVVSSGGETVLHTAARAGQTATVAALLDRGCDSNVLDLTGRTALQLAAGGGFTKMVALLLQAGATVDHQDEGDRDTAAHAASRAGFSLTLELLCKERANLYMKNRGGFTALHLSCQAGHNQCCRLLLTHGCRPDLKNNFGDTPLHTAARYGHAGVTRILLSAKCRAGLQNKNGDTALHIAAAMGRRKLTRVLLEAGEGKTVRNHQGETPGDIAVRKGWKEVESLLSVDRLEAPLQSIISDLERSERGRGGRGGGGEARRRRRSKGTTRKSSESKGEEKNQSCDCGSMLERLGAKLDAERGELMARISENHEGLGNRLGGLEERTREELKAVQERMKETLAEERRACQDRGERKLMRRAAEDLAREARLREEVAGWVGAVVQELEGKGVRKLGRRRSRRETRAIWSEIRNGALRRSSSVEQVEEWTSGKLVVGDRPQMATSGGGRVRRNSEGNYDEIGLVQDSLVHASQGAAVQEQQENIYENINFAEARAPCAQPPPLPQRANMVCDRQQLQQVDAKCIGQNVMYDRQRAQNVGSYCSAAKGERMYEHLAFCSSQTSSTTESRNADQQQHHTSDCGSLDSHNDSGYSTRLGASSAPTSPSLSSSPILDPAAILLAPTHWTTTTKDQGPTHWSTTTTAPRSQGPRYPTDRVIISASSLV